MLKSTPNTITYNYHMKSRNTSFYEIMKGNKRELSDGLRCQQRKNQGGFGNTPKYDAYFITKYNYQKDLSQNNSVKFEECLRKMKNPNQFKPQLLARTMTSKKKVNQNKFHQNQDENYQLMFIDYDENTFTNFTTAFQVGYAVLFTNTFILVDRFSQINVHQVAKYFIIAQKIENSFKRQLINKENDKSSDNGSIIDLLQESGEIKPGKEQKYGINQHSQSYNKPKPLIYSGLDQDIKKQDKFPPKIQFTSNLSKFQNFSKTIFQSAQRYEEKKIVQRQISSYSYKHSFFTNIIWQQRKNCQKN